MAPTEAEVTAMDGADALAHVRDRFILPADKIYLDGACTCSQPSASRASRASQPAGSRRVFPGCRRCAEDSLVVRRLQATRWARCRRASPSASPR